LFLAVGGDDDDVRLAMELFWQYCFDISVERKFLKEYAGGDLDAYRIRTKPKAIFFDCDDTLYFDSWKVARMLSSKIKDVTTQEYAMEPGHAYQLYKEHGTALRGMMSEGIIDSNDPEAIAKFLRSVHDIDVHKHLVPDPSLREMLLRLDPSIPKYIFTASVSHHAEACLKALGIDDLFDPNEIIDVVACEYETKHSIRAFELAMEKAGIPREQGEQCIFFDDSLKNLATAREMKWRAFLVGKVGRDSGPHSSEHAELELDSIHRMEQVLPELFVADAAPDGAAAAASTESK